MTYPCTNPNCPSCYGTSRQSRRWAWREAIRRAYPRGQVLVVALWSLACLLVLFVWFKPASFTWYALTTTLIIFVRIALAYRRVRRHR